MRAWATLVRIIRSIACLHTDRYHATNEKAGLAAARAEGRRALVRTQ
jgi:hypothetical protein